MLRCHVILFLLFVSVPLLHAKNVLIINSYHDTFSWTKNQVTSFTDTLSNGKQNGTFDFYIEYMDTKRFKPTPKRQKEFLSYLRQKYKNIDFELLYVTDDNALNFVRKHKGEFADAGTKVVFSGVNNTSLQKKLDASIYSGVYEKTAPKINEQLALLLLPNLQTLYLIGDDSVTDKVLRKIFKKELQNPQIEYIYLSDKNIQNVTKTLKNPKANSAGMLVMPAAFEDANGRFVPMQKAIDRIGSAFNRPLFATAAVYMDNTNVVGGYCVSGHQQGRIAAHRATVLLNKEMTQSKQFLAKTPGRYFFDMDVISKTGLHLEKQRYPEAVFLHQKRSLYDEYTFEVNAVAGVIVLLLLFALMLARKNNTLKRTLEGVETLTLDSLSAVLILDKNLRCIDANDVALEMFGCQKQQLLQTHLFDLVAKDSLPDVKARVAKPKSSAYEIIMKRYDKSQFHALVKGSNVVIENKKLRISSIIDISERIRHEKALQQLNENLEQKVRTQIEDIRKKDEMLFEQSKVAAMGELVSAIAHQWRQPLNAVSIAIQNLDEDYEEGLIDAEFIDTFIGKNQKIIQSMSQTIDDFRDFFQNEAQAENFDIKDAISETCNMQRARLQYHGIRLAVEGESFLIKGYRSQFLQVLLNLCNNAKDAMEARGVENGMIEITLDKDSKTIRVVDNGGGIDDAVIKRIFEPYFTTKDQGKGVG
ncbi:MAG: ATP-binding protein, partial [Campylobacterota bacterium]